MLLDETNLFCDWYLDKKLSKKNIASFRKRFDKIVKNLILNLKFKE